MITRSLLRTKIVHVLYAYYQSGCMSLKDVEKNLDLSVEQAQNLYLLLLELIPNLTRLAELDLDNRRNKYIPTHEDLNPNMSFVENKVAQKIAQSTALTQFIKDVKLSWLDDDTLLRDIYAKLQQTDFYKEYLSKESHSLEDDKELWRKIFKTILTDHEGVVAWLEELNIYWNDDYDTAMSFVLKTVKSLSEEGSVDDAVLPLYKNDEDREFAHVLLKKTIENADYYESLVNDTTKNWETERIAFMDMLVMKVALAEVFAFPTIPVSVTMNEYIEIVKAYSTPRSHVFINGVLDRIVAQQLREGNLIKPTVKK